MKKTNKQNVQCQTEVPVYNKVCYNSNNVYNKYNDDENDYDDDDDDNNNNNNNTAL